MRILLGLLLLLCTCQLGQQAYRASYRFYADTRNPYVYAHTSTDILRLASRIEDIAEVAPDGHDMLIKVITPDYWPLPWYLRKFNRVGYWNFPIDDPDAAVVITSEELAPQIQARMQKSYQSSYYGLRPGVLMGVYFRQDLWEAFIKQSEN